MESMQFLMTPFIILHRFFCINNLQHFYKMCLQELVDTNGAWGVPNAHQPFGWYSALYQLLHILRILTIINNNGLEDFT